MRTTDCMAANCQASDTRAVAALARRRKANAVRKGARRPRRSPQVEKSRAPTPTSRVMAKMAETSPSVSPRVSRAKGMVAEP